jgi:phosphoadenosine phosphosulfate reductase
MRAKLLGTNNSGDGGEMTNLFDRRDNVEIAIERLRAFEQAAIKMHPDGYWPAFSGGKDSVVMLHLVRRSGVKYTAHYNWTTVDPPELIRFIKTHYPDVHREFPEKTMWQLIPEKRMPPTRKVRYCCEQLKEQGGQGRFVVTGIRWAESATRKHRGMVETCYKDKTKRYLHPIIDWSTAEIWQYIRDNNLPVCSLYNKGFARIGCVMCPFNRKAQIADALRWPQYKKAYLRAFEKMLIARRENGLETEWQTGEEVWEWWVNNDREKDDPDQMSFFE